MTLLLSFNLEKTRGFMQQFEQGLKCKLPTFEVCVSF